MENEITYEQFYENILPGNYFLTKSMEISKIETSGTLWYTKKFLVYYYYIFLSDNITTINDTREICRIFDTYISSMPERVQESAKAFFYSSSPFADIRSESFKFFGAFSGTIQFDNASDRLDYYEMAKKYYFAFLMESGGQSGVKKHIKDKLYTANFCFSQIDEIIQSFFDGRQFNLSQTKNDYMAFLRNERQILYYYGFVHSKSSGSNDKEFSSLTPVGELALRCNYFEFIALWEHQKIKMISQPVTVDIQNISTLSVDSSNFHINHNPYLTILSWLKSRNSLSDNEYKFIVSRLNHPIKQQSINPIVDNIGFIEEQIRRFGRRGDLADEDFQKELKKYLLGIRSDFSVDNGTNPIGLCNKGRRDYEVRNVEILNNIIGIYKNLVYYKEQKYNTLFERCEVELRRQYREGIENHAYNIDSRIKIDWDIYNIHIDRVIFLGVLVAISKNILDKSFTTKNIAEFANCIHGNFGNALKYQGINKSELKSELKKLLYSFENSDYNSYLINDVDHYELLASTYTRDNAQDLEAKIEEQSNIKTKNTAGERYRNTALIQLIKAYNNKLYAVDGKLICECCGEQTFITTNNDSYLEYHHLIPFSTHDGPDHYLNIYAICPMCHRKIHFIRVNDKPIVYQNLSQNSYRQLSIEDRLKSLFRSKLLRSYQLEFLLADKAITEEQYQNILAA